MRVERFANEILSRLPQHGCVLEIGAGEGELAARLSSAGHDVVAIDKVQRSTGFPVLETSFEDFDAGGRRFDCVAVQFALHHVHDLDATLVKIVSMLKSGGIIAVDDFGWERSEDPQFRDERREFHTSEAMLSALRSHFRERSYFDHAYSDEGAGSDCIAFTFTGTPL